jgi:hypothetical protein
MATGTQFDLKTLVDLFEKTSRGDQSARVLLKDWFDARSATMRRGKEARQEMGTLTYLVAELQATRKLAPRGKYNDLSNDPASVASRHWQRFQAFCEDVEKGQAKTVDDFVIRVNALTEYVCLDLVIEKKADAATNLGAIGEVPDGVDLLEQEDDGAEADYPEWLEEKRVLLRRIFHVLPPRLFIVLILKEYCHFKWTQMAEILGTTTHYVRRDYTEATKEIGRQLP